MFLYLHCFIKIILTSIFRNLLIKDIWESELIERSIPFASDLNLIDMLIDAPTIGMLLAAVYLF